MAVNKASPWGFLQNARFSAENEYLPNTMEKFLDGVVVFKDSRKTGNLFNTLVCYVNFAQALSNVKEILVEVHTRSFLVNRRMETYNLSTKIRKDAIFSRKNSLFFSRRHEDTTASRKFTVKNEYLHEK